METYNHLLVEFNTVSPPEDTQLQFKLLSDELKNQRNRRKMHYLIRKNELKSLLNEEVCEKSFVTCVPVTSRSLATSSVDRLQQVSNNKQILKREIGQIQHQIQFIRKQTNQINKQLKIYEQKREELEVLRKRSQLDMFNASQLLYIQAANINSQEYRQQEIISHLKKNKGQIIEEINELVKQKQMSQNMKKKWKAIKNVKIKTIKQLGMNSYILKQMITTLYGLQNLVKTAHKKTNYQKRQYYQDLQFLDSINKKSQITSSLAKNNIVFNQVFANDMISFYKQLQQEFDRNERANKQINSQLQTIHQNYDKVCKELEKAYLKKQKQNQMTLKQIEKTLKESAYCYEQKCKLVTFFSSKLFSLLKKMNSLKKSIQKIVFDDKRLLWKRETESQDFDKIIQTYQEYLYKNPEEIQIKWSENNNKIEFYKNYICPNDLLRTFSFPEGYLSQKEELDNFETFAIVCHRNINQLIKNMYSSLKVYFRTTNIRSVDVLSQKDNIQTYKYFCVQSKEYYRRDDFKVLQKMEKNQLRKKGLLLQIPFNIDTQNQLITKKQNINNDKSSPYLCTSRNLLFNKKQSKYSTLESYKEEQNDLKCSSLRRMLSKLDSFRSKSTSKIFNRSTLNTSFSPNQSIQSIIHIQNDKFSSIRLPRNTVGAMQKVYAKQKTTFE